MTLFRRLAQLAQGICPSPIQPRVKHRYTISTPAPFIFTQQERIKDSLFSSQIIPALAQFWFVIRAILTSADYEDSNSIGRKKQSDSDQERESINFILWLTFICLQEHGKQQIAKYSILFEQENLLEVEPADILKNVNSQLKSLSVNMDLQTRKQSLLTAYGQAAQRPPLTTLPPASAKQHNVEEKKISTGVLIPKPEKNQVDQLVIKKNDYSIRQTIANNAISTQIPLKKNRTRKEKINDQNVWREQINYVEVNGSQSKAEKVIKNKQPRRTVFDDIGKHAHQSKPFHSTRYVAHNKNNEDVSKLKKLTVDKNIPAKNTTNLIKISQKKITKKHVLVSNEAKKSSVTLPSGKPEIVNAQSRFIQPMSIFKNYGLVQNLQQDMATAENKTAQSRQDYLSDTKQTSLLRIDAPAHPKLAIKKNKIKKDSSQYGLERFNNLENNEVIIENELFLETDGQITLKRKWLPAEVESNHADNRGAKDHSLFRQVRRAEKSRGAKGLLLGATTSASCEEHEIGRSTETAEHVHLVRDKPKLPSIILPFEKFDTNQKPSSQPHAANRKALLKIQFIFQSNQQANEPKAKSKPLKQRFSSTVSNLSLSKYLNQFNGDPHE